MKNAVTGGKNEKMQLPVYKNILLRCNATLKNAI
jgi:hypothetical protein